MFGGTTNIALSTNLRVKMTTAKEKRRLGWWFLFFTILGKLTTWPGIVILLIFLLIWNILPLPKEEE